jgi:DNA ligase D-like protein (predicted ligase)
VARRRGEVPSFVPPMVALLVKTLPEGEEWVYEVKFDGYRALLIKNDQRVEIRSRSNRDLTKTYPATHAAGQRLHATTAMIDGELVAVDAEGRPSFQALQHRSAHPSHTVVFYAFDLLHLDGKDMTRSPLVERRAALPKVVKRTGILLSEILPGTAQEVAAAVQGLGLEGVVAKRARSLYHPGQRNGDWQKLKLDKQQEFVIGGYRPGSHGIDALLVGYYKARDLHFAGKVRAGFTPLVRREVASVLGALDAAQCPFVDLPTTKPGRWGGGVPVEQMAEMRWVKPTRVAQIRFVEWTADGHLRHAAFLGLRTDKTAKNIRRES